MKKGLVLAGPDVPVGPLALLTGTFEERLKKAAGLGFDGIELMVREPTILDWNAIRSQISDAGLEISQIVTGELFGADGLCLVTSDMDLYRRSFERTCQVIDMAAFMGTMVNIGRLRGQLKFLGELRDPWSVAVERLHLTIKYAKERGVRITLEPVNRYESDFINNAADGMKLVRDVGLPNLGLMLDLFHMNIEDPVIEEGLKLAGDKLWHVHIADTNRLYPGAGHMDFDPILKTLLEMQYDGYLSAEHFPIPDGDTAAERTMEFLKFHLNKHLS
jgi:5-keto-L-gluconate epimerase